MTADLVPMLTHISPLGSAYCRVIEVALGGVVALAVSFLVFPERAHGLFIEVGARLLELIAAGGTSTEDLFRCNTCELEIAFPPSVPDALRGLLGRFAFETHPNAAAPQNQRTRLPIASRLLGFATSRSDT